MADRRVVMVAMPCREVVEIGGALDIFRAANLYLPATRLWVWQSRNDAARVPPGAGRESQGLP